VAYFGVGEVIESGEGVIDDLSTPAYVSARQQASHRQVHRGSVLKVRRCGDRSPALDALLHAERIAPHELREHRLTHELLRNLLTRECS
jgi:hypothetical protein